MILSIKLILKKDIKLLSAPKYEEISIAKLWPQLKNDPNLIFFFPEYSKGKLPSFDFFWTVFILFF
jgi:hypothetical protein